METSFACYGRRIGNRETNGSLYNPCRGEVGPSHCTLLNRFISKRKIKEDKRIQPQLPADRTTILRRSIRSGEGGRLQITFRRISSLPTNPSSSLSLSSQITTFKSPTMYQNVYTPILTSSRNERTRIASIGADKRKRRIAVARSLS